MSPEQPPPPDVRILECREEVHGDAVLRILNAVIAGSTAVYDYSPRTTDNLRDWFTGKRAGRFPVIGAVDAAGALLGFATYGPFRAFPAYKYTVEHSVHVRADCRGLGIGTALMRRLIAIAIEQEYHTLVGVIDAANDASISFHRRLGFTPCGTIREVGFKFGRWLDVALYQLVLATPSTPVDG